MEIRKKAYTVSDEESYTVFLPLSLCLHVEFRSFAVIGVFLGDSDQILLPQQLQQEPHHFLPTLLSSVEVRSATTGALCRSYVIEDVLTWITEQDWVSGGGGVLVCVSN